jgi:hypothetical protein
MKDEGLAGALDKDRMAKKILLRWMQKPEILDQLIESIQSEDFVEWGMFEVPDEADRK